MNKISIVVPCFNEEEMIPKFYQAIKDIWVKMEDATYEIIFINDGSNDHSLSILRMINKRDPNCTYLSFSRNFGKEAAMYAGLSNASGNFVVIMDVDLQHPPTLLPAMYHAVSKEGYDCAGGKRTDRSGEGKLRAILSKAFYKVIDSLSDIDMKDGAGDFRMMSRQMVDSLLSMKEYNRYSKGLFSFVGFDTKWIEFHNVERVAGESKWNFGSLFKYAIDGIMSFSTIPLVFASVCGVIFCVISLIMAAYVGFKTLLFGNPISGYTTIVCVMLMLGGIQLFFVGIVGQYLSKNYMESKNRPLYIIKETSLHPVYEKVHNQ
ncbi:MAG: glycosyltransferase family 2 protein [Erysipelotrichaceae bacterium]